jgi:hypothetical protein
MCISIETQAVNETAKRDVTWASLKGTPPFSPIKGPRVGSVI